MAEAIGLPGGGGGTPMGTGGTGGAGGVAAAIAARPVAGPTGSPAAVVPAVVERLAADRQLVAGTVAVIGLARLVDGPVAWMVAALVGLGVLVGAGWSRVSASAGDVDASVSVRARWEAVVGGAVGFESGLVPAVLAFSLALAVRLVPFDWSLAAALVVGGVLLDRTIALERLLAVAPDSAAERWRAVLAAVVTAFLGFAGVGSMIAGGLAGIGGPPLLESDLVALAAGDAAIAVALGFRLARLGPAARREAVVSGLGFGLVVAIGAGLLRAIAVPQLVGPALLTLVVYLWDALNATTPSIRRDPRWRWQLGLLILLSVVVIGWNLRLRAP